MSIWVESARAHTSAVNQKSEAKSWQTSDRMSGALAGKHAAVSMDMHKELRGTHRHCGNDGRGIEA